jgi:nicotinamidase/pyrazinamidase
MKKLLIVIDFQKDFVDGSLGFSKAEVLDERIYQKIKKYQDEKQDIIFTFDTHQPDYLNTQEGRYLPIEHCLKGSQGWELYGKVGAFYKENNNKENIKAIEKITFASLDLGVYLKDKDYQEVELVGLVSNICVLSNAVIVKAALPETKVIVDASCTASASEDLHNKCLDVMAGIQVEVVNR